MYYFECVRKLAVFEYRCLRFRLFFASCIRYNAYRFFVQNVIRVDAEDGIYLQFEGELESLRGVAAADWNVMDRWVLSAIQSLVSWFHQEMDAYRLYTVVPRLVKFVDQLTNWYVRLNRRRIKVISSFSFPSVCHFRSWSFIIHSFNFVILDRAKTVSRNAAGLSRSCLQFWKR